MEKITMENLLKDFNGVVSGFSKLVADKDIEGVKKALAEIQELVLNNEKVELDHPDHENADHVLHDLLKNIGGYIERESIKAGKDITSVKIIEIYKEWYEELEIEETLILREISHIKNRKHVLNDDDETKALRKELEELEREELDDLTARNEERASKETKNTQAKTLNIESEIERIRAEIARRKEAWETIQFTEPAENRKEEYYRGTAKLEAELASLEEQQENRKNRKERIAELNRVLESKTSINIDKEKLTKELEYQRRKLRKAEEMYDEFKNPDEYTPEYNDPRKMDSVKQRVHEANIKSEIEDIKNEIANLESKLNQADKENNIDDNNKNEDKDLNDLDISEEDKERLIILQNRLKVVRETKERIKLLSIEKTKTPGEKTVEKFDVTKAVKEIGDKIFKTAEIRKELSERNITREEFLEFYKQGRNVAEKDIEQLENDHRDLAILLRNLVLNDAGEDLYKAAENAIDNNKDSELIENAEELRKRSLMLGYPEGIPETEIKTKDDAENFIQTIRAYTDNLVNKCNQLENLKNEQIENIEIFDREISILEKEIELEKYSLDKISDDAKKEKTLRNKVIEATMDGNDSQLIEEWNKRISRLYSHKKLSKEIYIDENGEPKEVEFETIEDYPEYKEDAYFLNLSKYKQYLELSSKYENSNGDMYSLGEDIIKYIEPRKAKGEDPQKILDTMSEEWKKYVDTFHGFASDYQIKYENLKTAGSTLKSMVPVKNLTPMQKTKAVAENAFRFFGIRKPEFTKVNPNGETVKDVRGGLTTIGIDAAVVGGIAGATVLGGIPALTTIGVGYAAKGIVTAANMIKGAAFKRKYKEEIEAGVPILRNATEEEKMVARKDYYNTVEERSRIGSWAKAWNDRIFRRKRADETEKEIVSIRKKQSDDYIDRKTEELVEAYKENKKKSDRNHEARNTNYREEARSAYTYNEIIADPDSINRDLQETISRTAQNAVTNPNNNFRRRLNVNTTQQINDKYVKSEWQAIKTQELDTIEKEEDSIATTTITEEERYTAEQQRRDRINKIWTMILTTAGNVGIEAIKNGLTQEVDLPDKTVTTTEKQPIYEDVVKEEMPDKMGDFKLETEGLHNTYTGDVTGISGDVISTGNSTTMLDPTAVSIQYTNASGEDIVISMAEKGLGYTTKHVHALVDFDISSMTPAEIISTLAKHDPVNYENMIQAMGLENKTAEEIAKVFVEKGMVHLQDKSMRGWQQVAGENVTRIIDKIIKGYKDVAVSKVVDGGTKKVFAYEELLRSVGRGIGTGAAINLTDVVHEANSQTKKERPGTYEQNIKAIREENDREPSED